MVSVICRLTLELSVIIAYEFAEVFGLSFHCACQRISNSFDACIWSVTIEDPEEVGLSFRGRAFAHLSVLVRVRGSEASSISSHFQ